VDPGVWERALDGRLEGSVDKVETETLGGRLVGAVVTALELVADREGVDEGVGGHGKQVLFPYST